MHGSLVCPPNNPKHPSVRFDEEREPNRWRPPAVSNLFNLSLQRKCIDHIPFRTLSAQACPRRPRARRTHCHFHRLLRRGSQVLRVPVRFLYTFYFLPWRLAIYCPVVLLAASVAYEPGTWALSELLREVSNGFIGAFIISCETLLAKSRLDISLRMLRH